MRIKVIQKPPFDEADGIDLKRFIVGRHYEVGASIGALLLAEGWAAPVADTEPALLIPSAAADRSVERHADQNNPPNLFRETYPPYADDTLAFAAERRKRPPKKT